MILQQIKQAQLSARKARDTAKATLLTTVIGEAEMVGKSDGNRESTEAEVLLIVKKFEKNLLDNIRIYSDRKLEEAVSHSRFELAIIQGFLPLKLTDDQVKNDILTLIQEQSLPLEQKSLGVIVKTLKSQYGDQFDGQQVSTLFKSMI